MRGLLDAGNVEVVAGELSLIDETTAVIAQPGDRVRFVAFRDLVFATGSSPVALPELPFDGERVLDSSAVLDLDALPASLCIVGAGYIGVEIGIALARLGTRITVIEVQRSECCPNCPPTSVPRLRGACRRWGSKSCSARGPERSGRGSSKSMPEGLRDGSKPNG